MRRFRLRVSRGQAAFERHPAKEDVQAACIVSSSDPLPTLRPDPVEGWFSGWKAVGRAQAEHELRTADKSFPCNLRLA
jgi:hypothetical protein